MKKILLILLAGWLPWAASAQENKEDKAAAKAARQYLPKQGDWSVGVDVIPLLKYAGTIFSEKKSELNYLSGAPFSAYGKLDELFGENRTLMPDVSIMGKYFLSDVFALRANIGLKISSETQRYYVNDDKADWQQTLNKALVIDNFRTRKNGVSIMLGGEYRKGNRRVQGVFGGGILFAFMNNKVTCKYGNDLTSINQRPTTTPVPTVSKALATRATYEHPDDWMGSYPFWELWNSEDWNSENWDKILTDEQKETFNTWYESFPWTENLPNPGNSNIPGGDDSGNTGEGDGSGDGDISGDGTITPPDDMTNSSRVDSRPLTKFNKGADFYIGLTGSAGVEWFVAPKISLGAEVNLSLYYMFGKQTYLETESYNATLGHVEKQLKLESPGNRGFYMATECLGGSLSLNFYF